MNRLNTQQRNFVISSGNLILIAGPGTGKTHTLCCKLEYLVENSINETNILALTFTNKAAAEMRKRLGLDSKLLITTFHGLAFRDLSDVQKQRLVTDELQREVFLKKALQQTRLKLNIKEAGLLVSLCKIGETNEKNALSLAKAYNQILKDKGVIDYDDLLLRFKPKKKYEYVFVDEFQDTNKLQYQITKSLVADNGQVQVVGDPHQSVYTFRGASSNLFTIFEKEYKAKRLELNQTYRSARKITTFTNSFYRDRNLQTQLTEEGEIEFIETPSRYSEANYIVEKIKRQVGGVDLLNASDVLKDAQSDFSGIAVIFRSHFLGRVVEQKLKKNNIPIQKAGGNSIWANKAGQAFLELARTKNMLEKSPLEILHELKLPDVQTMELRPYLFRFDNISQFLNEYEILKQNDFVDPKANLVSLLTMHASKGLEFETVFVVGLENKNMPMILKYEKETKHRLAEEKRLLYVATTRAKQNLILLYKKPKSKFFDTLNLNAVKKVRDEKAFKKRLRQSQIKLL